MMVDETITDDVLDGATVRTFRVPGVGMVRVEIGDEQSRDVVTGRYTHGHTFPAYRVSIDDVVIMSGADWGVPAHRCTDDMDAMLDLLSWAAVEGSELEGRPAVITDDDVREPLHVWVTGREFMRAAITRPGVDALTVARQCWAGEL